MPPAPHAAPVHDAAAAGTPRCDYNGAHRMGRAVPVPDVVASGLFGWLVGWLVGWHGMAMTIAMPATRHGDRSVGGCDSPRPPCR